MGKLSYNIKFKGADKLAQALLDKAKMEVVKKIVKQNTAQLQLKAQQKTTTAYTGHMEGKRFVLPTGATKRGIILGFEDMQLTGFVRMTKEYNPYLEKGTRFMKARPVLYPTYLYQRTQFIEQLKKVMK